MIHVIATIVWISAFNQGGAQALAANEQLFSPQALSAIRQLPAYRQSGLWPESSQVRFIEAGRLPGALVAEAKVWTDRVITAANLLPATERPVVGLRGERFPDTIAFRFRLENGKRVQILEEESGLIVTVDGIGESVSGSTETDIEALKRVVLQLIRIPEGKLANGEFHNTGYVSATAGIKLFVGLVDIESQGKSIEYQAWWNSFSFQAVEGSFTFIFRKSLGDGKVGTHKGSEGNPPIQGRFGDIGQS